MQSSLSLVIQTVKNRTLIPDERNGGLACPPVCKVEDGYWKYWISRY